MKRIAALCALLVALTGCSARVLPVAAPSYEPDCRADAASPPSGHGRPPDLPADVGVGPGVFVYRPCSACGAWLLTRSGRRYAVPTTPRTPRAAAPTLGGAPFTPTAP